MDRAITEKLRYDRRLMERRNWVSPKELERELAALPDVSHKAADPEKDSNTPGSDSGPPDSGESGFPGS